MTKKMHLSMRAEGSAIIVEETECKCECDALTINNRSDNPITLTPATSPTSFLLHLEGDFTVDFTGPSKSQFKVGIYTVIITAVFEGRTLEGDFKYDLLKSIFIRRTEVTSDCNTPFKAMKVVCDDVNCACGLRVIFQDAQTKANSLVIEQNNKSGLSINIGRQLVEMAQCDEWLDLSFEQCCISRIINYITNPPRGVSPRILFETVTDQVVTVGVVPEMTLVTQCGLNFKFFNHAGITISAKKFCQLMCPECPIRFGTSSSFG